MKRWGWIGVGIFSGLLLVLRLVVLRGSTAEGLVHDAPTTATAPPAIATVDRPASEAAPTFGTPAPAVVDGGAEPFDVTVWGVVDMYISSAWWTCTNADRLEKAERNFRTWPLQGKETAEQRQELVSQLADSTDRSWVKACAWVFDEDNEQDAGR